MSCKGSSILSLAIFLIALSIGFCRSTADGFGSSSDSFSSSQPRKTLDQEIGSPSELAWQAWLLVENKNGGQSPLDSSNILRRITPKSIFIAPELIACPSGYSSDGKGVCKPDPIKIDEDAQREFFLKRLNALYDKFGSNRKKPEAQGPLQINIPISLPPKPKPQPPQQPEQKQPIVTENRLAIPVIISQQPPVQENQEAVRVVVYKVANETKKPDEEKPSTTAFYLGHSNSSDPKKNAAQTGQVVQVAEIVDEMNQTYSGVVDYKIPISLKPIFNRSDAYDEPKTTGDAGLNDRQTEKKVEGQDSSEDSSPTMVLLLSPTKLPSVRSTTEREVETEATDDDQTVQTTEDDRRTDTTIQTVAPLDGSSTLRSTSTERSFTQDDETVYADEESQTQDSEDHEDYDDTTAEDEFAEGEDELLKPGEAGMMIPSKNQELVRSKTQKQQPSTLPDEPASTTFVDTTTITTFPTDSFESTFKTGATEELPSTYTTEIPSTIVTTTESGVKETTLYVTTPLRVRLPIKTTQPTPAPMTTISDEIRVDETFETERDLVTEPEVIFSTQQNNYGRKRPMHPIRVAETPAYTSGLFEEPIARTELPPVTAVDFHRRQKPTMTVNNEPILFKNDRDIPSDFKDQMAESSKPSAQDFKRVIPSFGSSGNDEPSSTYVRFPEQTPASRSQFGYVRFPSDDVNSIHSPDGYKDHLLSPYRSRDGDYSATSTKSSVPARQKSPSTNWRLPPPGVRMDRQHQQQQQRQQKQKPMLLRFWARMPLVRDLSFYPTTSHGSHNEPIGGSEPETARLNSRFSTAQPRRVNYYKEMSSHDVNRLLAQQLGQPAIGG